MKVCFCRFLLAVAIIVIALLFWTASWAKIAIIAAAVLLAITALFYKSCCCAMKKGKPADTVAIPAPPTSE